LVSGGRSVAKSPVNIHTELGVRVMATSSAIAGFCSD